MERKSRCSKSSEKLRSSRSQRDEAAKKASSPSDLSRRATTSQVPLRPPTRERPRFANSPYQSQWNQKILQEIFHVAYGPKSGNWKIREKNQRWQARQNVGVNPFSGAVFPRQSFQARGDGLGDAAMGGGGGGGGGSEDRREEAAYYSSQDGGAIIHSTSQRRMATYTQSGGFKRPGSKVGLTRNSSGLIGGAGAGVGGRKKKPQKLLINVMSGAGAKERRTISPGTQISMSQQAQAQRKGVAGGGGGGGGGGGVHNHINISINHNYRKEER